MKAFSKLIALLLLTALLLGLCACNGGAATETAAPETAAPVPEKLPELRISELMPSNKACLALDDGSFPDWVELCNAGTERAELAGCSLLCKGKAMQLDALSLEPGACALVPLQGTKLPKEGETVQLLSPGGAVIDSLTYEAVPEDRSLVRGPDGLTLCRWPTPGYENSKAGYEARQQTLTGAELVISEAMVYNDSLLPLEDGSCYDWVELKNVSDRPLDLSGYALSDKGSERRRGELPARTLAPGELLVLLCGAEAASSSLPTLDFSLAADTEQLFLSRPDGSLCDYVSLHDIPLGMSCGRMDGEGGFFYFAEPSPGADNTGGCRRVSDKPRADGPDGVFEDVKDVTVTLSGEGPIYLTRDGSVPTADSERYDGPIRLTETGVLRAVCAEEGCIPSEPLDLSYFLNEGHTLPVVSLLSDPDGLFSFYGGLYTNPLERDWERMASVALYADERGFAPMECSIKLHGATSRINLEKKSFKLKFRSRYDGELNCDLFENGVTVYTDLLLRAAQESRNSTEMRDVLMHELSQQCDPSLSTQAHRYCVLYINGEYWGLYAIREAHSAEHFARHYGYDPEQVDMWQQDWPYKSRAQEVYDAALAGDLRDEAVYAEVKKHLDIESMITWAIIESYCYNIDMTSPNMRFYYSHEDEVLHYALVDLDLGFYSFAGAERAFKAGYPYSALLTALMESPAFRAQYLQRLSEYLHGPLTDAHFLEELALLSDEIRDEIPRDYTRWKLNPSSWQSEIDTFLVGSTEHPAGSHAWLLADSAREYFSLSEEEWNTWFADIPRWPDREENAS